MCALFTWKEAPVTTSFPHGPLPLREERPLDVRELGYRLAFQQSRIDGLEKELQDQHNQLKTLIPSLASALALLTEERQKYLHHFFSSNAYQENESCIATENISSGTFAEWQHEPMVNVEMNVTVPHHHFSFK